MWLQAVIEEKRSAHKIFKVALASGKNEYFRSLTQDYSSEVKASASNVGDPGSIPGLGRSPGEGDGNPLQYSCLKNPMDGGAW